MCLPSAEYLCSAIHYQLLNLNVTNFAQCFLNCVIPTNWSIIYFLILPKIWIQIMQTTQLVTMPRLWELCYHSKVRLQQVSYLRQQLKSLSDNISINIQAVFKSRSIQDNFRPKENKPVIVRNQSVVYYFKCDQCEADYVGYTRRHLRQWIAEHKYSALGKHIAKNHKSSYQDAKKNFSVLKRC